MDKDEFRIGLIFYMAKDSRWLCTDVGTRVVVAIRLEEGVATPAGPPYVVGERVIDEYAQQGCQTDPGVFRFDGLGSVYVTEDAWRRREINAAYRDAGVELPDSGWRMLSGFETADELSDPEAIRCVSPLAVVMIEPALEIWLYGFAGKALRRDRSTSDFAEVPVDDVPHLPLEERARILRKRKLIARKQKSRRSQ